MAKRKEKVWVENKLIAKKENVVSDICKQGKQLTAKHIYPKAMTIRYDETQEKEILVMMEKIGEKTMSKAFLKTPELLAAQHSKVNELILLTQQQEIKIKQMQSILMNFADFTNKLTAFVEKEK